MRVLVVDTYYPAFLASHYSERPGLAERPYGEQLASLMDRMFGTADAYSRHLRELGHDADDVIVNCPELQLAWAREHGRPRLAGALARAMALPATAGRAARHLLLHAIARAQVDAFQPDVVYAQDLNFFSRRELDRLRTRAVVAGQIASPAPEPALLRGYSVIFTSFPHFVPRFRELGVESEYFRIAFYERVAERLEADGLGTEPDRDRPHGAVFVGGVHPVVHERGTRLLEEACSRANLEVWGYGADALPDGSAIRARHHGEAWGLDMYRILARSRIVVNRHIDAAEGHANNMRLYEATGAGAMLLTDAGSNLGELFEPGREVVVYDGAGDLVAKLDHYLAHDDERVAIARAGQERTLREHTYGRRIEELAALLEARL